MDRSYEDLKPLLSLGYHGFEGKDQNKEVLGYAYEHGMDALVQLLAEESVDVADWTRASVV